MTLTGGVSTWSERKAAVDNACGGGAKYVKDRLQVRYKLYGPEFSYLTPGVNRPLR